VWIRGRHWRKDAESRTVESSARQRRPAGKKRRPGAPIWKKEKGRADSKKKKQQECRPLEEEKGAGESETIKGQELPMGKRVFQMEREH